MRRLFYFQQVILFSTHTTPRILYMAKWLGIRLTGQPMQVVNAVAAIPDNIPVINYSATILSVPSFHIVPHALLFEKDIQAASWPVEVTTKFPVIFPNANGDYFFDVLAASFFLISRYEEYLPYTKDEYGRYCHTNSIAFKNDFLKRPIVDEWVSDLKQALVRKFPTLEFAANKTSILPTYDVDVAWSYRNKGLLRNAGGMLKDLMQGQWRNVLQRLAVITKLQKDPFEIFETLEEAHRQLGLKAVYFFLLAAEKRGYDKNISPRKKPLQQLIKWLQETAGVGIHFSWAASKQPSLMKTEQQSIEGVLQAPVFSNRMHYLHFELPKTFQQLLQLPTAITKEYSMGYGAINGFRAGTSYAYHWYDLSNEATTALTIIPFAWMDANSIFEQKDTPEKALMELQEMYDAVKKTGGTFVTICHNHLMGLDPTGRQWWKMYMQFLRSNKQLQEL